MFTHFNFNVLSFNYIIKQEHAGLGCIQDKQTTELILSRQHPRQIIGVKMISNLYFHILYEQVSNVHLQAHNHLDPHQEDEESICKPDHQDILQIERLFM